MRRPRPEFRRERGKIVTQRLRAEDPEPNLAPPAGARGSNEVRWGRRGKVLVHGSVEPAWNELASPSGNAGLRAVTEALRRARAASSLERAVAKVGPVAPAALEAAHGVPEREQEDVDVLLRFSERVQGRRPPLRRPEEMIYRYAVVVVGYQAVRRRPGGDTRTAAARRLAEKQPAARESRDPGGPSASVSNHAAPGLQRVRESLRARAGDGEVRHGRPGLDARCVALDRGAQQPFGVVRPAD